MWQNNYTIMIDRTKLVKESNQVIFIYHNKKLYKGKFMWFLNNKIEIIIDGDTRLISIPERSWHKLFLTQDMN